MRQQWLSPISPRIPTVEAHPTAMPPDTESDEEHKATKAYPESPGEPHTHTEGKHKYIHKGEQAQSARHVQCTYEHANRHKSRWMQSFTGKLTHTLAQFQKHSKPWTNTNTDPLVLPGKATRYHIKHVTVLSEINPVPNRSFHFFFLLTFNLYLPICHNRIDISFTLTMEALEGNWHEWNDTESSRKSCKKQAVCLFSRSVCQSVSALLLV